MNVGSGWTLFVVVIGLLLGLLLFTWKPGAHWARRICIGLSVLLMLYGSVMTLWGISVATGRNVPTGDLPYLVGLPIVSGMGGLVSLVVAWRLSSSAAGSA